MSNPINSLRRGIPSRPTVKSTDRPQQPTTIHPYLKIAVGTPTYLCWKSVPMNRNQHSGQNLPMVSPAISNGQIAGRAMTAHADG